MMTEGFGEQPVLGTIKQCYRTSFGWQGMMEDGTIFQSRAKTLPVRKDKYIVSLGKEEKYARPVLGVYLLEWKKEKIRSARRPAKSPRRF